MGLLVFRPHYHHSQKHLTMMMQKHLAPMNHVRQLRHLNDELVFRLQIHQD
jgi:hypothetical protein